MQVSEAKTLFDAGVLVRAVVVRAPMAAGWNLELYRKGAKTCEPIERQRGGYRVYTTIDAAVSTAEAIGFREIAINLL